MVELILVIGAVATSALAIGALIKFACAPLYRFVKRWAVLMDDWFGEEARPGVAARAGVMERMAAMERQVTPNGGSSDTLADRVVRLEEHIMPPQTGR